MKCDRSYLISHLENFSPDTLKLADILRYKASVNEGFRQQVVFFAVSKVTMRLSLI